MVTDRGDDVEASTNACKMRSTQVNQSPDVVDHRYSRTVLFVKLDRPEQSVYDPELPGITATSR